MTKTISVICAGMALFLMKNHKENISSTDRKLKNGRNSMEVSIKKNCYLLVNEKGLVWCKTEETNIGFLKSLLSAHHQLNQDKFLLF